MVLVATTAVVAAAFGIDRLAVVVHKFYAEHHHSHPRAGGHHGGLDDHDDTACRTAAL